MTSLDRRSAGLHCCQHGGSLGASTGTAPVRFCNLMSQLRWCGAIFQIWPSSLLFINACVVHRFLCYLGHDEAGIWNVILHMTLCHPAHDFCRLCESCNSKYVIQQYFKDW